MFGKMKLKPQRWLKCVLISSETHPRRGWQSSDGAGVKEDAGCDGTPRSKEDPVSRKGPCSCLPRSVLGPEFLAGPF